VCFQWGRLSDKWGLAKAEMSWFSALCGDDYEFLGVTETGLLSSWERCRDIALGAEVGG
jgi:alkanesulfonate monooxygenase